MIARKLAGLFAILALAAYMGSWLWSNRLATVTAAPVEEAWFTGVLVSIGFWLTGLFLATMGVGLVQEVLAERHSRNAERRLSARDRYHRMLGDDQSPPGGGGPSVGAGN